MKRRHLLVATVGCVLAAMIGCNNAPPSPQPAFIPKSKKFGEGTDPDKMASHSSPVPAPKQ
jgi:hypothetical protein